MTAERKSRDIRISNPNRGSVSMPFELINNLVVIPMRINDSDTLHFILDTGAGRTIITELSIGQEFTIQYEQDFELSGLGNSGPVPALFSGGNEIQLRGIRGEDHGVVFLLEGVFNLSNFMGRRVNGLVGYDIFKNFIVEIDYRRSRLYFHDPDMMKEKYEKMKNSKGWKLIPLEIENNKPYIRSSIIQNDNSKVDLKLLIDSGASKNLFLYPTSSERIIVPEKTVHSYLGSGLNGEIYGEIGRAKRFMMGDIQLEQPIVSYPEEEGVQKAIALSDRNGSIGADLLRRFTVFLNYADSSMLLKPNKWFKKDFTYNVSGIEISTPIPELPYYEISKVREGSPAQKAGARAEDIILGVNNVRVYNYDLNELLELLQQTGGKRINLRVQRGENEVVNLNFVLNDETI